MFSVCVFVLFFKKAQLTKHCCYEHAESNTNCTRDWWWLCLFHLRTAGGYCWFITKATGGYCTTFFPSKATQWKLTALLQPKEQQRNVPALWMVMEPRIRSISKNKPGCITSKYFRMRLKNVQDVNVRMAEAFKTKQHTHKKPLSSLENKASSANTWLKHSSLTLFFKPPF